MSTSIKSFGQPSNLTCSSYENGGSTTVSSFGPKNCLRLRADASMYSKSGGSIQLRGIGAKSFLDAKNLRLVQPIQIRFKQAGANKVLFPNQFLDAFSQGSGVFGQNTYAAGGSNKLEWRTQTNSNTTDVFNGLTTVTNGLLCQT